MASFFKCWSHLFYAICRQIFNFNNKQKKIKCDPGLRQVFFFCYCFFFPMFRFVVVFFPRFASKVEKKYHLVRIVPHRNCTDTCFSKMFYQYYSRSHNIASVQYVWYSHSPLVKTYHVKEYSPALNGTQVSEIRHLCPKSGSCV